MPELDAETLNEQVLGLVPLSRGTSFLSLSVPWEVHAGGVTNFFSSEFQMRLLYENETVTEDVRLGRRGEILATARDALESTLGAMPALGLCVSSGENELHRERERRVDNGCIDIDNLTDGEKAAFKTNFIRLSFCQSGRRRRPFEPMESIVRISQAIKGRPSFASVSLVSLYGRSHGFGSNSKAGGKQEKEWYGAGVGSSLCPK